MSGADVVRSLRAAGLEMPIIFLTVPDRPLTVGSELGHAEVLTLPVDGHTLLTTILDATKGDADSAGPRPSGTIAVFSAKAKAAPNPVLEEGAGMRSALEYLQKLDRYYSQAARPR